MIEWITDFVHLMFTGPVWPSSLLICLLLAYSVLVLTGLADASLDVSDAGMDSGADFAGSAGSIGAATVRWLHLDRIPVFIWISVFGFTWWVLSLVLWDAFDSDRYQPTVVVSLLLAIRNSVIAVGLTKIFTWPMKTWFDASTPYNPEMILGNDCEIATGEATPEFGRAKFKTNGSPLLLNIRTNGETLVKGQLAQIVDFDPETRIYIVQSSSPIR